MVVIWKQIGGIQIRGKEMSEIDVIVLIRDDEDLKQGNRSDWK